MKTTGTLGCNLAIALIILATLMTSPTLAQQPPAINLTGTWTVSCPGVWAAPRSYELLERPNGEIIVSAGPQPDTNLISVEGLLLWTKDMTAAKGFMTVFLSHDPMRLQGRICPLELTVINENKLDGLHTFYTWDASGKETSRYKKNATWRRN